MKRFVIAVAVTCALSVTAFGGEIPSTGIVREDPTKTATGHIPSTDGAPESELFAVLLTMLSVF